MQESGEFARPYAIAAFRQAREEGRLREWGEMLELLELVVGDPTVRGLIANPRVKRGQLAALLIDIAGDRLSPTGRNFVRVLAEYGRLGLASEIRRAFDRERAREEGRSEVRVVSAFTLQPEEERRIAEAMRRRLGTEVDLTTEVDPELIGGVVIRAGDLVIDASLRGRLGQLGQALG